MRTHPQELTAQPPQVPHHQGPLRPERPDVRARDEDLARLPRHGQRRRPRLQRRLVPPDIQGPAALDGTERDRSARQPARQRRHRLDQLHREGHRRPVPDDAGPARADEAGAKRRRRRPERGRDVDERDQSLRSHVRRRPGGLPRPGARGKDERWELLCGCRRRRGQGGLHRLAEGSRRLALFLFVHRVPAQHEPHNWAYGVPPLRLG